MRSKNAKYNIIFGFLLQIVSIICGLIIPRLIIKNFGSNINGLLNSITQFLAYITLLESGFGPVITSILYKPIAEKDNKSIIEILKSSESFFRKIAIIFIVYIVVLCFVFPYFVADSFDNVFTVSLIIIIGLSTFAEYFFGITYNLYLHASQKKYIVSIIHMVTTILNVILIYILISCGFNIQIVKLVSCFIYILRPLLQNFYVRRKCNIVISKKTKKIKIKQKWDGLAQHVAGVIFSNTDVAILSIFSPMSTVSIYSVYNLVIVAVRNFISILTGAVEAIFGDMIAKKENKNFNNKFSMYEFIYFSIITIVYSCTTHLIVPFVKIYTKGITDANYIQNTFSFVFVFGFFIHAIKSIYNVIAYSAGKFRETRKGAWVEAFSNLFISLLLVRKYGLIGVAIGTSISIIIRCIEFIIFTSKNILKRRINITFSRVILSIFEFFIIFIIGGNIINFTEVSYLNWIYNGIKIFVFSTIIVVPINILFYKKEFKMLLFLIKERRKK